VTSSELFEHAEEFAAIFEGVKFGGFGKGDDGVCSDDGCGHAVSSLYWTTVHQVKGQKTWREEKLLAGQEVLSEALVLPDGRRLEFDIRPQAFFQTNTKQAEVLYGKVLEFAELDGKEVVWDLYCGTGTIGLFCAHKAGRVLGIEVNESAVENARRNVVRNEIGNAEFYLGTVEKVLGSTTLGDASCLPDVVIVDPPRSGLGEKVVEQCVAAKPKRIVYVSCNPSTMARDVAWFSERGYTLKKLQPVDMFPQTHHVECVGVLGK